MSRAETPDWDGVDVLDERSRDPHQLEMPDPDELTGNLSWERAQTEDDRGGPAENDAERIVWLEGSDHPHRVTFALDGASLVVNCDCRSDRYRNWCAHLASCWWQWSTGQILVHHLHTGRGYRLPPAWLSFEHDRDDSQSRDIEGLTPAEMDAYLHCELGYVGVREHARKTGRAPGTVGNLLARAREKAGGRR